MMEGISSARSYEMHDNSHDGYAAQSFLRGRVHSNKNLVDYEDFLTEEEDVAPCG